MYVSAGALGRLFVSRVGTRNRTDTAKEKKSQQLPPHLRLCHSNTHQMWHNTKHDLEPIESAAYGLAGLDLLVDRSSLVL